MKRDVYTRLIKHATILYVIYMKADLSKDEYMHAIFFASHLANASMTGEEHTKHRRVRQTPLVHVSYHVFYVWYARGIKGIWVFVFVAEWVFVERCLTQEYVEDLWYDTYVQRNLYT